MGDNNSIHPHQVVLPTSFRDINPKPQTLGPGPHLVVVGGVGEPVTQHGMPLGEEVLLQQAHHLRQGGWVGAVTVAVYLQVGRGTKASRQIREDRHTQEAVVALATSSACLGSI